MKTPCSNCPFRSDRPFLGLEAGRIEEIVQSITHDSPFHCHKTLEGSLVTENSTLCIGAAIFLENATEDGCRSNFAFRLGLMFNEFTLEDLENSPVPVYEDLKSLEKGTTIRY